MSESEKTEAWNFLKDGFAVSEERIGGLYLMNPAKAVKLFKEALSQPIEESEYPAARQALDGCRVLMLRCIVQQQPEADNINALAKFSNSEFPRIRASVAQYLPTRHTTLEAISAIKATVMTETELLPLTSSITKLMAIYGLDYDLHNPIYKSIYLGLASDDVNLKKRAITRLESQGRPDFI
jgi:hypothetical protein